MFNEDWYSDDQLIALEAVCTLIPEVEGKIIEIGCWEGKSTVAIANQCYPHEIIAVDTWQGQIDESLDHISVKIAQERDVYSVFLNNMKELTQGNVTSIKMDCFEFLENFDEKIKFCHIDACHDYMSVKRTIEYVLEFVVKGGILCGDDYRTANRYRQDLDGGVERAVCELLPEHQIIKNFWWYKY